MANYNDLKTGIDAVIKTNGRQEISGAALNTQLKNMIAELGAGYQYMGVATPATNPGTPDANVFYLASEAGTYTNFGGIVINEGEVCALVWNGTWTKEMTGIATADQLNQLGQQVIYDVSAHNSGATFASLSALLSDADLATLIPTGVRCGGMSIRFIQTSDNKYVQFRYMGTDVTTAATFTNVANWQGVDDEPTAGSANLVKSGGVYEIQAQLGSTLHYSNNKVWSDIISTFIPKGEVQTTYKLNYNVAAWLGVKFFDNNNNLILEDEQLVQGNETVTKVIVLSDDAHYISLRSGNADPADYTFVSSGLSDEVEELEKISAKSINRFNKEDILRGHYIEGNTYPENEDWFVTGYIPVNDLIGNDIDVIGYGYTGWGGFYDENRTFLDSFTPTVPDGAKYMRFCCPLTYLDTLQIGFNLDNSEYFEYNEALSIPKLKVHKNDILGLESNIINIKPLIPSVVYLRTNQEFSIWYRNIINCSQAFLNGNYSIRCEKKNGSSYENFGAGSTFNKFGYTPSSTEEFDLEIRIINTYTREVISSKVVHFIVKNPSSISNKSPKIVLLGDSFTDGHNVSKFIWKFLEDDGFTPVSVGVNSADYESYKDDAWAGYGILWFYNDFYGYHRSDRPASDDVEYQGTVYTKNEFIENAGGLFDFSYYMSHYHSGINSVDVVIFNIGLNDTSWSFKSDSELSQLIEKLDHMITSVHTFDANTKIILCQTTAQPKEDAATATMGNAWLTSQTCKNNQERWNNALIEHFDTAEYRTAKVYIAPVASNIDTENAFYTTTIHPDKFDNSIEEVVTSDIHPNEIGAKYIADTIVNTIEGLLQ